MIIKLSKYTVNNFKLFKRKTLLYSFLILLDLKINSKYEIH